MVPATTLQDFSHIGELRQILFGQITGIEGPRTGRHPRDRRPRRFFPVIHGIVVSDAAVDTDVTSDAAGVTARAVIGITVVDGDDTTAVEVVPQAIDVEVTANIGTRIGVRGGGRRARRGGRYVERAAAHRRGARARQVDRRVYLDPHVTCKIQRHLALNIDDTNVKSKSSRKILTGVIFRSIDAAGLLWSQARGIGYFRSSGITAPRAILAVAAAGPGRRVTGAGGTTAVSAVGVAAAVVAAAATLARTRCLSLLLLLIVRRLLREGSRGEGGQLASRTRQFLTAAGRWIQPVE